MNSISQKKEHFPIKQSLWAYLKKYSRELEIPIRYPELLEYHESITLYDKFGNDSLWETVFYPSSSVQEIYQSLTTIYAIIKAEGDTSVMDHLSVDRVDYCPFGNSKPFRIKIINNFNDNYDYFYVKKADASRVYGLEIEHLLSPNRIHYIVNENTLIEEHIVGIPGDQFIKNNLTDPSLNETRLAKEFIKFNERCFVRLLGDMRSYNFVIDMTPDFDQMQYRIRAIDFDQQSYEGKKTIYLPQFFKENLPFVNLSIKHINQKTIHQYQREERALIAKRIKASRNKLNDLLNIMVVDNLSIPEKIKQLKEELSIHYQSNNFKHCINMGEVVKESLLTVLPADMKNFIS